MQSITNKEKTYRICEEKTKLTLEISSPAGLASLEPSEEELIDSVEIRLSRSRLWPLADSAARSANVSSVLDWTHQQP